MTAKRYVLAGAVALLVGAFSIRIVWQDRRESGYAAFNVQNYPEARAQLRLIATLGDGKAQQLMSYMAGLGLGQPVDVPDAMHWMRRGEDDGGARNSVGEQAYYLGTSALDGLYGEEKKALGLQWLKVASQSGVQKARERLVALERAPQ